ncbi:hypothetical protein AaE_009734 [Aphanomyces astaci]|uniref:Uncharacterized protein n=1 Tax=Aphanomyces astaci TaxID=112090 RepID=A0A6A5A487_APHAT|nr:hypothetical protein AaE_009734 [Aphanomyces astaci]
MNRRNAAKNAGHHGQGRPRCVKQVHTAEAYDVSSRTLRKHLAKADPGVIEIQTSFKEDVTVSGKFITEYELLQAQSAAKPKQKKKATQVAAVEIDNEVNIFEVVE